MKTYFYFIRRCVSFRFLAMVILTIGVFTAALILPLSPVQAATASRTRSRRLRTSAASVSMPSRSTSASTAV